MLKEMRENDGRGLKQPARFAGVSVSTLSDYEAGRRMPSVPVLASLCRFYGVRSEDLIGHLAKPAEKDAAA